MTSLIRLIVKFTFCTRTSPTNLSRYFKIRALSLSNKFFSFKQTYQRACKSSFDLIRSSSIFHDRPDVVLGGFLPSSFANSESCLTSVVFCLASVASLKIMLLCRLVIFVMSLVNIKIILLSGESWDQKERTEILTKS